MNISPEYKKYQFSVIFILPGINWLWGLLLVSKTVWLNISLGQYLETWPDWLESWPAVLEAHQKYSVQTQQEFIFLWKRCGPSCMLHNTLISRWFEALPIWPITRKSFGSCCARCSTWRHIELVWVEIVKITWKW